MIRLLVRHRNGGERFFESAKDSISIGRAEANDLRVDEPSSSRRHCLIQRRNTGGGVEVRDLGSKNGTLVNGARIERRVLEPGDEIRIGDTKVYFDPGIAAGPVPAGGGEEEAGAETAVMGSPAGPPAAASFGETSPIDAIDTVILSAGELLSAGHEQEELAKLRKLLEINKAINSELNVRRLFERILDTAIAVTGAERGFLLLLERADAPSGLGGTGPGEAGIPAGALVGAAALAALGPGVTVGAGAGPMGESLRVKASRNFDRETIRRAESKLSRSVLREVIGRRQAVRIDDAGKDSRFGTADSVHDMQLAAILAVPLVVKEKVLGAIYLDNRFRKSSFNEAHLGLLEVVADQAAIAVENARLFEENLEKQEALRLAQQELEELNKALKAKVELQAAELDHVRALLEERRREYKLKYNYDSLVTRSPKLLEVLAVLDRVTDSTVSVLIQGESGTGKELIARALHVNGQRARKAFVSQNCAAIPATLMESEFFGHARGAFTGAEREKPGLFELADGGTIFLDEIGDMSPDMQTKLLRVLQGGELRRVGSKEFKKVDVRVISATNRDLQQLIREGKFREDLYYRLNVINIHLPPLRERKEDIPVLVGHFLKRFEQRRAASAAGGGGAGGGGDPGGADAPCEVPEETLRLLTAYRWPGNVRELENEIERAATLSRGVILPEHLSPRVIAGATEGAPTFEGGGPLDLKEIVARKVEEVERRAIAEALRRTAWKKTLAAELLGISRPTLDAKIEKLGLKRE